MAGNDNLEFVQAGISRQVFISSRNMHGSDRLHPAAVASLHLQASSTDALANLLVSVALRLSGGRRD
ncbi:hypothetical protein A6U86_11620 [Rhizobium sp. AC27/96]|nr:hypothetical protein A6U86_11620 [Rhizobium sp. AC27/96]